jgi:hypothetical protein
MAIITLFNSSLSEADHFGNCIDQDLDRLRAGAASSLCRLREMS